MATATRSRAAASEDPVDEAPVSPTGVRLTPERINPDDAAHFGAVGPGNTAEKLIEHHKALYPPALRAVLARKWDEPRTEEILQHLDDLGEALRVENVVGAAVRGANDASRVVTLTTRRESGRIHNSFLPYADFAKHAASIHRAVEHAAKVADARRRGLPWSPQD